MRQSNRCCHILLVVSYSVSRAKEMCSEWIRNGDVGILCKEQQGEMNQREEQELLVSPWRRVPFFLTSVAF